MASFPGQFSAGPPLPNQVQGLVAVMGGGGPTPTQVQLLLQGQDTAGATQAQNTQPTQGSHQTVGWKSVAGASAYKIYRNANGAGYALLTTRTGAQAASDYSSYVTGQGSFNVQDSCDCAYQDTAATTCVGFPGGPVSGVYFPNNGYTYQVLATVAGVDGPLSTDNIIILFAGGKRIMCQDVFNPTANLNLVNWADTTCPTISPLGNTTNMLWTLNTGNTILNPFTGASSVDQNLGINGMNFMNVAVCAAQANSAIGFGPERAGDQPLLLNTPRALTAYGPALQQNVWVTYKLPLNLIYRDEVGGTNTPQLAYYKNTYASNGTGTGAPNEKFWMEQWFSAH